MLLLDVNVVLAASRDDHPQHAGLQQWFTQLLAGDDPFTVPVTVWASFLRLSTHRRVFPVPTPLTDAFAFVDAVREQPHHVAVEPGPRHLRLLHDLCEEASATGDLVPDAVLAAIAVERSATVVTFDRDFARFPSVPWVRPPMGEAGSRV